MHMATNGMVSRETRIQRLLSELQTGIERSGTDAEKQRRRQVLRGARAALWAMEARPFSIVELSEVLHEELFGRQLCRPARQQEDVDHDR